MKVPLTHAEFVAKYRQNKKAFVVNWASAFHAQSLLPWNYRLAWICLSIVEWGSFLGGPILAICGHWLIGLCVLIFGIGVVMPTARRTACQFVLDYSVENEEFWRLMFENGVFAGTSPPTSPT